MDIVFDRPDLLWVALVALPLGLAGFIATRHMDRLRRATIIGTRVLLVAVAAIALASPSVRREHDDVTVVAVVDISGSVRRFAEMPELAPDPDAARDGDTLSDGLAPARTARYLDWVRTWLDQSAIDRELDDRFGIVVFDGEATAVLAPTSLEAPDPTLDVRTREGTDIEDALRLAAAMLPRDTAGRIVLFTDGNQTGGDALATTALVSARGRETATGGTDGRTTANAAGLGIAGVPIDVVPIAYREIGDVRVVEVIAPTTAQPGQTVAARVILESTGPARGRLTARVEGAPVDLTPGFPGSGRQLSIPAGRSAWVVDVPLGTRPINRIDIGFAPDDGVPDALPENDIASAVTATPGRGRTLVVSSRPTTTPLPGLLEAADIEVSVVGPDGLPTDLLSMQDNDLIVLDDLSASAIPRSTQEVLTQHIEDLGGGLLVIGGEQSFGAGGWTGTPIADVLPILTDPPKDVVLPTAALVLVIDRSGSMARPVAGARASQQEVANEAAVRAIQSLRRESFVGVISFSDSTTAVVELDRHDDREAVVERIRRMAPGGGTNIPAALKRAERMLAASPADRKFVVLMTDGRSNEGGADDTVRRLVDSGARVTTISIGDEADEDFLGRLAEVGNGDFIRVINPRSLPRVLVDTVQVVNRPLIKEGTFEPVPRSTGSAVAGDLRGVPSLGGLVVTAPRKDPSATIEAAHPDGEPLLARWQVGLGRVAAFTSDFGGMWSPDWEQDAEARAFWLRLARETTRPRTDDASDLALSLEGDRLEVVVDAADDDGPLDFLTVDGTVHGPMGSIPVTLRQTAPGRYEGSVPATAEGEYVVALAPRSGSTALPPVVGGLARRSGAEFAALESDLELLDAIAETSGGRTLDPSAPAAAPIFDRTDLPSTVSLRPTWVIVLAVVLGLYLLDIATRRIAWSGSGIATGLAARAAATRERQARATTATRTTGNLRTATLGRRGDAATDEATDPADAARGAADAPRPRAGETPTLRTPAANAPGDSADASGVPGETAAPAARPERPPAPEPRDDVANETTGGLLAAKRRARDRLDGVD